MHARFLTFQECSAIQWLHVYNAFHAYRRHGALFDLTLPTTNP